MNIKILQDIKILQRKPRPASRQGTEEGVFEEDPEPKYELGLLRNNNPEAVVALNEQLPSEVWSQLLSEPLSPDLVLT